MNSIKNKIQLQAAKLGITVESLIKRVLERKLECCTVTRLNILDNGNVFFNAMNRGHSFTNPHSDSIDIIEVNGFGINYNIYGYIHYENLNRWLTDENRN